MRSPFLTAVGAGAGTMITLGGATFLVSGAVLSVAKRVVRQRKMAAATTCTLCQGTGFLACQVCMGKAIIRCRPPVSLKQLKKRQQPPAAGSDGGGSTAIMCSCPACGATRQQRCLNCLGEGRVCLPS